MQGTCARLKIQTARGKQPDSESKAILVPFVCILRRRIEWILGVLGGWNIYIPLYGIHDKMPCGVA